MYYLTIALAGAGGIGTLIGFLKAALAEKGRVSAEARALAANDNAERWKTENAFQRRTYVDQLNRRDEEIEVLKKQRKDLLDALEKSSVPGAIRESLLVSLGIK
jgi:hypothetical protein